MDSEQAALASAQQKHHKHMLFGKKQRYIEVFQCSGEDMNLVLNGGYQAPPAAISKPPLISSGMLTTRPPQPQPLQISIPPPLTLSIPHPSAASTNTMPAAPTPTSTLIAQQQAQYIAQQNLLARQQAAAAQQSYQQSYQQFHAAQLQAAAQMPTEQMFLQNLGYLSNPLVSQNSMGPVGPSNIPVSPHHQFFYLPRPIFPMGLIPGMSPFQNATAVSSTGLSTSPQGVASSQMTGGQQIVPVSTASAYVTPSVKRSYDNAFRNDQLNISAAKRAFHTTPGSTNLYGTYPTYPQL